jgi:hypothetical protein
MMEYRSTILKYRYVAGEVKPDDITSRNVSTHVIEENSSTVEY